MLICSVGECMVELNSYNSKNYKLSFAGDTANTAIYLSRLGAKVLYITSVGTEKLSERMVSFLKNDKLNIKYILRDPKRKIGLYIVENNQLGERNFFYWRLNSAARLYFQNVNINSFSKKLLNYNWIYFSGITLSIYNDQNINKFYQLLKILKRTNTKICMDLNVRINNWKSKSFAREIIKKFYKLTNLVFLTKEDIFFLGFKNIDLFNKIFKNPNTTKVYRNGIGKIMVYDQNFTQIHTVFLEKKVLDTTGCGDAFNAAFIYHYSKNSSLKNTVKFAHKLAKQVAHNKGAIIPKIKFKKKNYL